MPHLKRYITFSITVIIPLLVQCGAVDFQAEVGRRGEGIVVGCPPRFPKQPGGTLHEDTHVGGIEGDVVGFFPA